MSLEILDHRFEVPIRPEDNTLAGRAQQWLDHIEAALAPLTVARYKEALDKFQIFTAGRPVNTDLWVSYQKHMIKKGNMPASVHKQCDIINQFFKWCAMRNYITTNPCRFGIKLPPILVKTMPIFTHDEYLRMLEYASTKNEEYWLTVASYNMGASLVDVCLLKWESIDMEGMVIHFVRQKTKRFQTPATVTFDPGSDIHKCLILMAEEIGSHGDWPGNQYVCPDLAARYLGDVTNPQKLALRIIRGAGITGKTHKTFRWTFISNWANSGASTSLGCKVVGTKNPAIFTRYVNPDISAIRQGITDSMRRAQARSGIKTAKVPC